MVRYSAKLSIHGPQVGTKKWSRMPILGVIMFKEHSIILTSQSLKSSPALNPKKSKSNLKQDGSLYKKSKIDSELSLPFQHKKSR